MRFNSLAFRLLATSLAWTLLVLPVAGYLIFSLYREQVQLNFDERLKNLLNAIAEDSMTTNGNEAVPPPNTYEPLFEFTNSGWYWQVRPIDQGIGRTLVSPSLTSEVLPSPYDKKFPTDNTGTRWMNVPGPGGAPIRILEVIDTPGHDTTKTKYSIIVAGPLEWLEAANYRFRNLLAVALSLAGLGLVAVTLFQVRFGLLPLRRIEKGLADIRSGTSGKRAAASRAQRPHSLKPGCRRPGADAGRQSGACVEDAARRHHQRGARG